MRNSLGGNSLIAVKILYVIEKELDVELLLKDIFQHSTIDQLVIWILEQQMQSCTSVELDLILNKIVYNL